MPKSSRRAVVAQPVLTPEDRVEHAVSAFFGRWWAFGAALAAVLGAYYRLESELQSLRAEVKTSDIQSAAALASTNREIETIKNWMKTPGKFPGSLEQRESDIDPVPMAVPMGPQRTRGESSHETQAPGSAPSGSAAPAASTDQNAKPAIDNNRKLIRQAIEGMMPAVHQCFSARAEEMEPITFHVTVDPDGSVAAVGLDVATSDAVRDCVKGVTQARTFPKVEARPTLNVYAYHSVR